MISQVKTDYTSHFITKKLNNAKVVNRLKRLHIHHIKHLHNYCSYLKTPCIQIYKLVMDIFNNNLLCLKITFRFIIKKLCIL